jgi:nicotinamide-nucleotide amidase
MAARDDSAANTPGLWQVAVGDELLEGRTADTNSRRVQLALGGGVRARGIVVVPDRAEAVAAGLDGSRPGELVVITGGLGSTPDDLTREMVAAWAGVPLTTDARLQAELEARGRARGIADVAWAKRQAQMPAGLEPLTNRVGSAPALVGPLRDRTVVMLPGVPAELEGLLPDVVAWLRRRGVVPPPAPARLWRTAQRAELALVRSCEPVRERYPDLDWSWWLTRWGVDVRIAAAPAAPPPALARLDAAAAELEQRIGATTFARAPEELNVVVQEALLARGATLAVAESCTAGLLGAAVTEAAGSSEVFLGGVICYADAVKRDQLGVPEDLLYKRGAVSEAVARALAAGCRERCGSTHALAITGIAGPGGGSAEKPVGTTWIALATPAALFARCHRFPSNRSHNRRLAVATALDVLRRALVAPAGREPWLSEDTWARSEGG